jgi:hypothetical protein
MLPQNGGRPPPRRAGESLPIEPPTKALVNEFTVKRLVSARSPSGQIVTALLVAINTRDLKPIGPPR